jgi:uncharacterized repeat protein (TIGR01451 family)
LATVVGLLVGMAFAAGAAAAPASAACGYGSGGTMASTLCWIDMAGYNQAQARSVAGQPMTIDLPGGYTISFVLRDTPPEQPGVAHRTSLVGRIPTWSGAYLGNSAYRGTPGSPALITNNSPPNPAGTGGARFTLDNIVVRDSAGAVVTGYGFVVADAEATGPLESMWFSSDRPLNQIVDPGAPQPCSGPLTGVGTTSVSCTGAVPTGAYGALLLNADTPTRISASIRAAGTEAVAFAIVTSKIELAKTVAGRVRPTDSFDLTARSPEGSTVGTATTGGGTSATTGELTVLPRTLGASYTLSEAATPGSGALLSDYAQSWACTNNGSPIAGGSGASASVSPEPGDNIRCTLTNTQLPADLSIEKTATSSPVLPGQNITYRLVVRNAGPSRATRAVVSDPLPSNLTFVSATTGCTGTAQTVACSIDSLDAGASRTFEVTARVADGAVGTLSNEATVVSDTPDPNPNNNRDREDVPIEPQADLEIVKRALSDSVVPGRQVSFELIVFNHGPNTARDVRMSDPLPRGLSFVSASRGCTFASGTVTCNAGDLASGRSITYTVVTRVDASVTADSISNTATVESPTRDPDPGNNRDSARVPSGPEADLSIVKVPSVDRVAVGGQLFYTLLVRNDGPSDAQSVVVTDDAGAGLTLLSARGSQGASCTVSAARVTCRLGTLAAGGTAQVLVSARADQAGTLTNTAKVDSLTKDPDPSNNREERRVTGDPPPVSVPQPADLEIVKTSNRRAVLGSGTITYTLRVRNNGPGAVSGVQVIDTPSLPVKVRSVRTSAGRCTTTVPIRCDLGTLASGASATVRIVAQPQAPGMLRNSASVTGDVPDPRTDNNIDDTSTKVQGLLKLTKTASARTVRAGGTLTYAIRVTNASTFALRSVRVCDDLPSGLVFVSSTPSSKLSNGTHCWTISALGATKSKTITMKVRVLRGAGGRKVNVATATAPNARGARARAATGTATIRILPVQARGGGVTG